MAKKFDFNEFMLQKGERLALGAALLIMIGLIGFGTAEAVQLDSPSTTAQWIRSQADQLDNTVNNGQAGELPPLPAVVEKTKLTENPIKLEEYAYRGDLFFDTPLEMNKRVNPKILNFDDKDYKISAVHVAVTTFVLQGQKDRLQSMGWLVPDSRDKTITKMTDDQKAKRQAYLNAIRARMMAMAMGPQAMKTGMVNWQRVAGAPGVGPESDTKGVPAQTYRLEMVPLDKPPPLGAEPAETLAPYRMVVITAAFPYEKQLAAFQRALRLQTRADLMKHAKPEFRGFVVQRRTVDPVTKAVKEGWKELSLEADFKAVRSVALGTFPENPQLKHVTFNGLVMRRPAISRGAYPDHQIGAVASSVRVLEQKLGKDPKTTVVLNPVEQKVLSGEVNIFQDDVIRPSGTMSIPRPQEKQLDEKERQLIAPEHCLLRVIDADRTLKAGLTYEYQVRIRAANPNYKKPNDVQYPSLADKEELLSDWSPTMTVTMPRERYVYGTELDREALKQKSMLDPKLTGSDKDMTWLQVHKWLETVNVNPDQRGAARPVGDWCVADVPVRRGEHIGRLEYVKLPMWFEWKKAFDIPALLTAKGRGRDQARGIPVNLVSEDLLVDWEGGRIYQNYASVDKQPSKRVDETANVEYLIWTTDGKLRLRNSRADKSDPERKDRADDFDVWVKTVEAGGGKPKGTGPNINIFDQSKMRPK